MIRRIALVASSYHPYVGGVESHVRHVGRELATRGHAVEVWTVDRGEHLGTTEIDGLTVRHLPAPLPARSASAMASFAWRAPRAWRLWRDSLRSFQPDLLHVQCFGPNGIYATALAQRTATPLVVSAHGETFMDDHDVFGTSALMRRGLSRALRLALETTGCSQPVLDDLRARFGLTAGRVVPNGVGPALASNDSAPDTGSDSPLLVLGVGRLERMKGFDLLLDAVAAIDTTLTVSVVLVGAGSQRDALAEQAGRLGLAGRVRFVGPLDEAHVDAWMRRADVVVMPSRREAFGIVALEAWRSGTALVATSLGGPASFVRDGVDGILVDPTDTSAFTHALSGVLRDPARRSALGLAGQESVRRFTWAATTAAYERTYDDVLGAGRPADGVFPTTEASPSGA